MLLLVLCGALCLAGVWAEPVWSPSAGEAVQRPLRVDGDHGFLGEDVVGPVQESIITTAHETHDGASSAHNRLKDGLDPLGEALDALETMQSEFFQAWLGDWPTANDWTGAVMGTYLSAMLGSLTRSYGEENGPLGAEAAVAEKLLRENFINRYFAQSSAYYFAEEAYSIRLQAYDDMLWVVLGWLESIKFINTHNDLHYNVSRTDPYLTASTSPAAVPVWHGKQFEAAFAHRANVFYDIVQRAWDERLCGGGLTWNPHLRPYKNTITNTLFISASIGMYLYHPGDDNHSPFISGNLNVDVDFAADIDFNDSDSRPLEENTILPDEQGLPRARPHDWRYLRRAIRAYDWLRAVNMTNTQGLFVDGYHIRRSVHNNTSCDERNEMLYTYNQGVLLSGLRGLWEATANTSYLTDGHALVSAVIAATGWHVDPSVAGTAHLVPPASSATWSGIGTNGILQELCDPSGTCSQDGQTFKGIFFHHLTLFCEPLPTLTPLIPGRTHIATPDEARMHATNCAAYTPWVARNAHAALATKNAKGIFGMWWGDDAASGGGETGRDGHGPGLPWGAVDVRNDPKLLAEAQIHDARSKGESGREPDIRDRWNRRRANAPLRIPLPVSKENDREEQVTRWHDDDDDDGRDHNDRGRGRTVETQGGGLMVLRALHELRAWYGDGDGGGSASRGLL